MNYVTCNKCNFIIDVEIYPQPNFCPKCGNSVEYYETNYCPKCCPKGPTCEDEELVIDDKFCYVCGNKSVLYDYITSQEN